MMCLTYALPILHRATIDGMVIEAPKSYAQFRATLQRVGDDGIDAVSKFMASVDESNSEQENNRKSKKIVNSSRYARSIVPRRTWD